MKKIIQSVFVPLLFIGLTSCAEDIDFNQFDDLEATPSYEASIFYLESPEDLINQVVGANIFTQNYNFDAFSSPIFADRVIEGKITYVFENTTSKDLEITVEFLDEGNNSTDRTAFRIGKAPSPISKYEFTYGESGKSIDIIKTLSTIRVTAENLGDNTSISDIPNPLITLKSSGEFRVRLK
jgi:hypothetical protein